LFDYIIGAVVVLPTFLRFMVLLGPPILEGSILAGTAIFLVSSWLFSSSFAFAFVVLLLLTTADFLVEDYFFNSFALHGGHMNS